MRLLNNSKKFIFLKNYVKNTAKFAERWQYEEQYEIKI
jgi:hypothetical protein